MCDCLSTVGVEFVTRRLNQVDLRTWRGSILSVRNALSDIDVNLKWFRIDGGDFQLLVMVSEVPDHQVKLYGLAAHCDSDAAGLLIVSRGGQQGSRAACAQQAIWAAGLWRNHAKG